MKKYLGTKLISAKPMLRGQYNTYRGWECPADENPADPGFLVEYIGGKSNHPNHKGYISWSPLAQFEDAYQDIYQGMSFGHAIECLKVGYRVARKGWNGKEMWLVMTPGRVVENLEPNSFYDKCGFEAPVTINSHIDMRAADGSMVVGWLASQTDMLAEDWVVISES